MSKHTSYLKPVMDIAEKAGVKILELYNSPEKIKIEIKSDKSPVTNADLLSNDIIISELTKLTPNIPILSEESYIPPYLERKNWKLFWLIDPIDGTLEFIDHSANFLINIALIEDHKPVLGISYLPITKTFYYAVNNGEAFKKNNAGIFKLRTKPISENNIRIVASKYFGQKTLNRFLKLLPKHELTYLASSLKILWVAEGKADIYPRFGKNYEWDTAAGQCILEQAHGRLVDLQFKPIRYNTQESLASPSFLAIGDINFGWKNYLQI